MQNHSMQWVFLGKNLVISPYLWDEGCQFNSRKVLDYLFRASHANPS